MNGVSVAAHKRELAGFDTSKGTIRFTADKPLPAALVRMLIKDRIAQIQGKGKSRAARP
jgi:uncharacterized protein YdhG (YjbR/CyaY superfamily)